MNPICCGKKARPWRKEWRYSRTGKVHSWMEAFRCKVCGHVGVPTGTVFDTAYMDAMDAIREAGIREDAEREANNPFIIRE